MAKLAPLGYWRESDDNGNPLAGGKVYFYEAGTSTPKDTFTDESGLTANANPVILDANGFADVWLGDGAYKIVTTDANDVTIRTRDNISGEASAAFGSSVVAVNANLNVTSVYNNNLLLCTNTITLSLLGASEAGEGFYFSVRNNGVGVITIDPDGSETIDGGATLDIGAGKSALIICNGTSWNSLFLSPTLGTAASEDIGTSGATVPLLSGNNTHSGNVTFSGGFNTTTTATTRETYSYSTETDAGTVAIRHRERWFANNASGTSREVLLLDTYYADATDASEDTYARYWNYLAGTQRVAFAIGAGLTLSDATGGDQGDGVLNAKGVRVNGVDIPFTNSFESVETAVAAGQTNFAHGLGVVPKIFTVVARAKNAVGGYAVGDEVDLTTIGTYAGGAGGTVSFSSVSANATNITLSNQGLAIANKTGTGSTTLNNADWKFVARGFA